MFLAENVIVSAIAFASHSATLNKLTLPALSLFGPPFCEQVLSTIWMKVFFKSSFLPWDHVQSHFHGPSIHAVASIVIKTIMGE